MKQDGIVLSNEHGLKSRFWYQIVGFWY